MGGANPTRLGREDELQFAVWDVANHVECPVGRDHLTGATGRVLTSALPNGSLSTRRVYPQRVLFVDLSEGFSCREHFSATFFSFDVGSTMYQLTCPHCAAINEVSAAKAGGEITCTACHDPITVPKLGELRNLPAVGQTNADKVAANAAVGLSGGRSLAFVTFSLLCILSLLGAAFCGVNWATTEVPVTTQGHLDLLKEQYTIASSAQMIREFEDITEFGTDIQTPLHYRTLELKQEAWKYKTIAFAAFAAVTFALAVITGRRQSAPTATV